MVVILLLLSYYLYINSRPIKEKWPYIVGNLEPYEIKNNSITFLLNITSKSQNNIPIYLNNGEIRIDVSLKVNNSFLNKSEYDWVYIDSNNNKKIDSLDKLTFTFNNLEKKFIKVYMHVDGYNTSVTGEYEGG